MSYPRLVNIEPGDDVDANCDNPSSSLAKELSERLEKCSTVARDNDGQHEDGETAASSAASAALASASSTQPSTPFSSPMSSVSSTSSPNNNNNNIQQHLSNNTASNNTVSSSAVDNNVIDDDSNASRTMEVTITVLTLHGIIVKKKSNKNNGPTSKLKRIGYTNITASSTTPPNNNNNNNNEEEEATIVASFSQNITKEGDYLTHVPSLPVPLSSSSAGIGSSDSSVVSSSSSTSGSGNGEVLQPVVHWPSATSESVDGVTAVNAVTTANTTDANNTDNANNAMGSALSTLKFQRRFVREGTDRYVPQTCPINLSISRNGKMALLGKVDLIINGEERGQTSVTVPITSSIRIRKRDSVSGSVSRKLAVARGIKQQVSRSYRHQHQQQHQQQQQHHQEMTPMVKIKGDVYQFGLEFPMLRVLVNVSDPNLDSNPEDTGSAASPTPAIVPQGEQHAEQHADQQVDQASEDNSHDNHNNHNIHHNQEHDSSDQSCDQSTTSSRSDNSLEGNSLEGEESSLLDNADYRNMNNAELHHLRAQLTKYERLSAHLKLQLQNAQLNYNAERIQSRFENERLRDELDRAGRRAERIEEELASANGEREVLSWHERRLGELMGELERRDAEVGCLREEIGELRERLKGLMFEGSMREEEKSGSSDGSPVLVRKEVDSKTDTAACLDKYNTPVQGDGSAQDPVTWGMQNIAEGKAVIQVDDDDEHENEGNSKTVDTGQSLESKSVIGKDEDETNEKMPDVVTSSEEGKASIIDEDENDSSSRERIQTEASQADAASNGSKEVDAHDATSSIPPTNEDDITQKKQPEETKAGIGWGFRLGRSLRSVDEKLKERQKKFREHQQQKDTEKASDRPKSPGFGEALILRLSNHGVKKAATVTALDIVEEGEIADGANEMPKASDQKPSTASSEGFDESEVSGKGEIANDDSERTTTGEGDAPAPSADDASVELSALANPSNEHSEEERKPKGGEDWVLISESVERSQAEPRAGTVGNEVPPTEVQEEDWEEDQEEDPTYVDHLSFILSGKSNGRIISEEDSMSMTTDGSDAGNYERPGDAVDISDHNVEDEARPNNNVEIAAPSLESPSNEESETDTPSNEEASRVSFELNSEETETKGEPSSATRDDAETPTGGSSPSSPTPSVSNVSGSDQQTTTKEGFAEVPDATTPGYAIKNDTTTSATALISADAANTDSNEGDPSCNIEQETTSSAINDNNNAEERNTQETGIPPLAADAGSPSNGGAMENEPTSSTSSEGPIAKATRESSTQTADQSSSAEEMEDEPSSSTALSNTYASKYATAIHSTPLSPMNVNHAGYLSDSDDDAFNDFMSFMYSKPEETVVRKKWVKPKPKIGSHELDFDEREIPATAATI